ncbi:MAG: iron chelate uptake ABC transporter family permease subunit, partial [Cypionkella sp.]
MNPRARHPALLQRRGLLLIAGLSLLVLVAGLWGLSVGAVPIPVHVIVNTLFNLDGEQQSYIIMRSRLPRLVLALLAGGALALSGAIIQAVIRNPLASPNIIGINAGAALFALGMVVLFPAIPAEWMPLAACLGGITAASF